MSLDTLFPNGQLLGIRVEDTADDDPSLDTLYPNGQLLGVRLYGSIGGAIPIGGIIMWSGLIADVPSGWAFCNGTDNSPGPDLRDKFIVGATQDSAGVAKTNIEGSLKVTGGVTGHSHSAHANLSHTGLSISDHTGLSHSLAIENHPDLTHPGLSHAASTFTLPDHSVASQSHVHASRTDLSIPSAAIASHAAVSIPSGSFASGVDVSIPSGSIASHAAGSVPSASIASDGAISVPSQGINFASQAGVQSFATSNNRSGLISLAARTLTYASIANASAGSGSIASANNASGPTRSIAAATASRPSGSIASALGSNPSASVPSAANASMPSLSGSDAAFTLAHGSIQFPSLSHQDIGTHLGSIYGVHNITQPSDHGVAGTLTHSFTEPNDHIISAHDTVLSLPNYYALAFIQRMV